MIVRSDSRSPSRALPRSILSLALVCCAAGLVNPAQGAVRYASPTGSSANPGTLASPWSIDQANTSLLAGDVCYLLPGVYSGDINPKNSGTSAARITYVGNLADPSQVTLHSISVTGKSYVSIKGVHLAAGIDLSAATSGVAASYDSVSGCVADGSFGLWGAWYCTVVGNSIGNGDDQDKWEISAGNRGYSTASITAYCTISDNTFNLAAVAQPHTVVLAGAKYCTIARNRVLMTILAGAADVHGRIMYGMQYNQFSDNLWELRNFSTYSAYIHNCRDSSSFNSFVRDTMIELGPGPARAWATTSGSYPGSVFGNRYDHCYIRCSVGDTWYYQNGMRQDTLTYCTIINTSGAAFVLNNVDMQGPVLIDHNTFIGSSSPGVLQFTPSPTAISGGVVVTNNIFYNLNRSAEGRQPCSVVRSGAFIDRAITSLTMNHNLFSYYGYINTPGDKSLGFSASCDPGQYAIGSGSAWCTTYGNDCNSRYGSPMFVDSTIAGMNPRLQPGSPAIGMATDRSDVGAYPFVAVGPDVTPPSSVSDLATRVVSDNSLELGWTAPGDDGVIGMASAYDLRWSTAPISAANFGAATAVAIEPSPLPAGVAQSYVMLSLTPGTTYYFALRARDEVGNWSGLSNVLSVTTNSSDSTPPAAIRDLSASP